MHLETLKVYCDLAELSSFSKTAEKHFLSQSAISQQLAQLELAHNCQLINRKKRPIEMTKEGQLLYRAAKDIIDRYEQFKSELNSQRSSGQIRINVGAIFSIGMHSLPNYVKKFMVQFPNIHLHIEYFHASEIYDLVLSGDVDVGLVAIPKKDKRLDVYDFEQEQLMFVCNPRHHFASEQEIDIHRIQFEKFIAFDINVPTRAWIDNILNRYSIVVKPVMEFDNIETIKRSIEINSGVSILPEPALSQEVKSGTLKAIPFSNEHFVRPTGIIVRKNSLSTQICRDFVKLLQSKH